MTFITEKIRGAVTTAAAAERPLIDLKWTWIATVAICAFFIGVREYEQMFGWKAGMDSYSGGISDILDAGPLYLHNARIDRVS